MIPRHLMLWIATTLIALAPQTGEVRDREGRIILPPVQRPASADQNPQQASSDDVQRRFHARALELRRSRYLSRLTEEELLRLIGAEFPDAAQRALQLARRADHDLLHGLMRVLATYGEPAQAKEIHFLLLTRSLGRATEVAVDTMATIARDDARELLFSCFTATRDNVRRAAAAALESRVTVDDVDRLVALAGQGRRDVRVRATRLLGGLRAPEVTAHLVAALGDEPAVAEAACRALVDHGEAAVELLQPILQRPANGHAFAFATFALAAIEDDLGRPLFGEDLLPRLRTEFGMPDPFLRATAAIGLAGMAWWSSDTTGRAYADHDVVDALVDVVAPRAFVPHVALIQDAARRRLIRLTGKDFRLSHGRWRDWWSEIEDVGPYVGARRRLQVDVDNAMYAVLRWQDGDLVGRFRGEAVDSMPPDRDDGRYEFLLTVDEMIALVGALEDVGFMQQGTVRSVEPSARALRLTVLAARCQTDPYLSAEAGEALRRVLREEAARQSWQLYRDPEREPDPGAFWRSERRWLAKHTDPVERAERLSMRIIARMPELRERRLDLAIEHLGSLPDLRRVIDGDDARALLDVLRGREVWDARSNLIADIVLAAGEAAPWRELLEVAESAAGPDQAPAVLARLFGLLGPDKILEAMRSGSREVRVAAMDEAVAINDLRAVPILVDVLADDDAGVRMTAVFSLGKLRASEARQPLIDLLANEGDSIDPRLRRLVWVALARIRGDEVFSILAAAFYSPDPEDRRAVLQAFAELRHPSAARELANVFALRGPDDDLGLLSLQLLRGLGDLLASPALRPHLDSRNPVVRRETAFALAEFGDPAALPVLNDMLARDEGSLQMVALIAGLTGVDLTERNDRAEYLRRWREVNALQPQGQWLIAALEANGVRHALDVDLVAPGAGTAEVAELSRLLVDAEPPYLRPLVARVLRLTTGEDFGLVTVQSDEPHLRAIAERYRFLGDADKAATGR